jgi:hypothetical protein
VSAAPAPRPPLDDTPEAAKARGRRNLAIAIGLGAFAAILFVVTMAQLAGQTPRLIY